MKKGVGVDLLGGFCCTGTRCERHTMPAFWRSFLFSFTFKRWRQIQGLEGFMIRRAGSPQGWAGHPFNLMTI